MELEKNCRLSRSVLWDLQKLAYAEFGPLAWGEKGVPFYLTSNPLIAKQFTACILAYLRDRLFAEDPSTLDVNEPFYLFDLGAGSGRLGYLILKALIPAVKETLSSELSVCYVMTDMVQENLEFLKTHPYLQPFIASGNLDFAAYAHTTISPLELQISKRVLDETAVKNPIGLICTYYFDTVPQDLFKAHNGKLEEGLISLEVNGWSNRGGNRLSPEMIANLNARFSYAPVKTPENYYAGMPAFNALLLRYLSLFDDTPFLFPVGGLESIHYFSRLSKGRMLLLAGDQGVSTEEQVREWGEPKIFKHASFSMAVSYHLLALYFQNLGGTALLTEFPSPKYVVMCGALGANPKRCPNLSWAFREEIGLLEPVEYFELTDLGHEELERLSLRQLILLVKLGNWDTVNFHLFFSALLEKLSGINQGEARFVKQAIYHVWENFYPVNRQEGDFVMNLGVLLFTMKEYEDALFFFLKAKEIAGERTDILKNIAHCYRMLGNQGAAEQYFQAVSVLKAKNALQDRPI